MALPRARRYAQAVFEIASADESFDAWASDLAVIAEMASDEDFAALLDAPQVPEKVKVDGVNTVLHDVSDKARNLVRLLVSNGQIRLAGQINAEYGRMLDEHRGIARADVVTAVPIGDAQRSEVLARLSEVVDKTIHATWREDPAIIGGVVARVGDRLIDGSVRSKLEALKESLARPVSRRGSASRDAAAV